MTKPDSYYIEQAQKYCKEGTKPTGEVIRERGKENKISMECLVCGYPYDMSLQNIKAKQGCPECARLSRISKRTKPDSYYINGASSIVKKKGGTILGVVREGRTHTGVKIHPSCGHPDFVLTIPQLKEGMFCKECGRHATGIKNSKSDTYYFKKSLPYILGRGIVLEITRIYGKGTFLKIQCSASPEHVFSCKLSELARGRYCPFCNGSSGELITASILEYSNIKYEREVPIIINNKLHRFDYRIRDCKGNYRYFELDGEQHYDDSDEGRNRRELDAIKDRYILINTGYPIIRIPFTRYNRKDISAILSLNLGINTSIPPYNKVPKFKQYYEMVDYYKYHSLKETVTAYKVSDGTVETWFKKITGMSKYEWCLKNNINNGRCRKVKATNIKTGEIYVFNSIKECGVSLEVDPARIPTVCNGTRKTASGYKFEYID